MSNKYFAFGACDIEIDGKIFKLNTDLNTKATLKDGLLSLKNIGLTGNECLLELDEFYDLTLSFVASNNMNEEKNFQFKISNAKYQGIVNFDLDIDSCGNFTFLFEVNSKNIKLIDVELVKELSKLFNSKELHFTC